MTDLFLLSRVQTCRIGRYFPLSHGIARVDDRRIVSAIAFVSRTGCVGATLRATMARTRRSTIGLFAGARLGLFNKIFAELAGKGGKPERIMIDATHLKAHRTAASLLKKGLFPDVSGAPKAA